MPLDEQGRTAAITRGAMRGLALPIEEREAKLEAAPPEAKRLLEQEIAALQWVQCHWWVWQEQGVVDEIVAFLSDDGAAEQAAA